MKKTTAAFFSTSSPRATLAVNQLLLKGARKHAGVGAVRRARSAGRRGEVLLERAKRGGPPVGEGKASARDGENAPRRRSDWSSR